MLKKMKVCKVIHVFTIAFDRESRKDSPKLLLHRNKTSIDMRGSEIYIKEDWDRLREYVRMHWLQLLYTEESCSTYIYIVKLMIPLRGNFDISPYYDYIKCQQVNVQNQYNN